VRERALKFGGGVGHRVFLLKNLSYRRRRTTAGQRP
jgi:hypothetical protein